MGPLDMPTPQGHYRYTYSSGARPLDGYTIKRAIGRGGFGEVYYATSDAGKEVALKLILRNLEVERRGVVQCMNLKCPNLLTVFDIKSNDGGDAFVVMEYVAGPSLATVMAQHPNGLPVAEVRAWLRGLVEGVAYLHDHGIVHRDLKPGNLFMEEGLVKIGDYGLAKLITPTHGSEHSESIGTCHYMAPEIASGKYGKAVDVYAIGVILYEMLTGTVPFEGESVQEIIMKHLTARPDVSRLPEPFRTIVGKALKKHPDDRPARVYDLLPADDAPREQAVRFIGDGKKGAPTVEAAAPAAPKADDGVFRIEAEEPVFYIGPETMPPAPPRQPIRQRLRANLVGWRRPSPGQQQRQMMEQAGHQMQQQVQRAQQMRQQQEQRQRAWQVRQAKVEAPPPAPAPPPEPPAVPSGRVRLAELTNSMLWAAPIAALLAVPVALMMGVDPAGRPESVAYLFGMTLLGAWGALIPTKLFEGRKVDVSLRRLVHLGVGGLVGLAGAALASWVEMGTLRGWDLSLDPQFFEAVLPGGATSPVGYAAYFGLLSLVAGTPWQSARDRRTRFSVFSVAKTTAVGGLMGLALPFPQPWGLAVAGLTSAVAQAVSPWSAPAAAYARYVAKLPKPARNVA